jgi:hypothetical protein
MCLAECAVLRPGDTHKHTGTLHIQVAVGSGCRKEVGGCLQQETVLRVHTQGLLGDVEHRYQQQQVRWLVHVQTDR